MARLELMDTVELMGSSDYRDRFVAEYIQTKIRYEKLKAFNTKIEAARRTGSVDEGAQVKEPKHDCPAGLLREQQAAMGEYLHLLEVRAVIEDIDLSDVELYLENKKDTSSTADAVPLPQGEGLKNPEIVRLEDPELKLKLEECEDDWDIVVESVARILEKGLFDDKDEEKIFAASLNVLHKIKMFDEPCEYQKENIKGITESVDPDDVSPDSIKSAIKCCTSTEDDCDKCYFNDQENRYCCDNLLRASLRYIVKLEESSEKTKERHCDKCVHLPICEYCSVHLKGFALPDNETCDMYLRAKESSSCPER